MGMVYEGLADGQAKTQIRLGIIDIRIYMDMDYGIMAKTKILFYFSHN